MPTFYLDTSALLKRYKTEEGTTIIDQLFELFEKPTNKGATSFLTLLEVIAAGRRLLKGGVIDEGDFTELMRNFLADANRFLVLRGLDTKLFIQAIELALAHALRTADALQLATALELRTVLARSSEVLIFIVDDQELCEAGKKEKLEVIDPREKGAERRLGHLTKAG